MLNVGELSLERHFQPVFEPLSFELSAGELVVVTGPNGSGKTTLIRLLAGLLDATSGKLENQAENPQYVGHDSAVKAELSVFENLCFWSRLSGKEKAVESVIARMGLSGCAEQLGRTLSAGQRRRTALARLLLGDADLWLLDEPYSNLDTAGIELVDGILDAHLSSGGSCVMATHGDHRPVSVSGNWDIREIVLQSTRRAA